MYAVNQQNSWPILMLLKEQIFELVRIKSFPTRPSRLESIFLCENLQDIRTFRSSNNRNLDLIYEVEIVDLSAPAHRTCMTYVENSNQGTLATIEQNAHSYWTGVTIQKPEILTRSSVRVISQHSA